MNGLFSALWLLVVLLSIFSDAHAQDGTRRVLILYPDSNVNRSSLIVGEAIRKSVLERSSLDTKMHGEFLELSRFTDTGHRQRLVQYLAEKYAHITFDAVVAIGPESLKLVVDNRSHFLPEVPVVFCCTSVARLANIERPPDVTGVVGDFDVSKTLSLAEQLQPNARKLVVIAGAGPFDLQWAHIARKQLAPQEKRFETRYLVGLTREAILQELSKLSRDTIVILLTVFRDGAGRDFVPGDLTAEFVRASKAPIYGPYDTSLGHGLVGGHMISFEAVGNETADLLLKIINGTDPRTLPPPTSTAHANRIDSRQLKRWNISEKRVPFDAVVLFKEPTLWQQHRDLLLATTGVFIALTMVLGALLLQIRGRRRAEASLGCSEERWAFAAASAGIGLWQYDISADQLWSSEHCRSMFGLPKNTPLTTVELLRAVHPDDHAVAIASIRAATYGNLADGISEFRVVQCDGQVLWLQARGRTTLDGEGRPFLVSGIFRDITSFKSAQLEAKQLTERVLSIQEEERERIAQELHDSTAQHLSAIGLNLLALAGPNGPNRKSSRIFAEIESSLQEASKELRAFTYLLHPPALASDGLSITLRRYIEGFNRRTGLSVVLRSNCEADELVPALQRNLMRIVQECLANVHRHASAARVAIRLRRVADRLHLVITDDGRGLPCKRNVGHPEGETLPAGVGIAGMSARVRHFGGTSEGL